MSRLLSGINACGIAPCITITLCAMQSIRVDVDLWMYYIRVRVRHVNMHKKSKENSRALFHVLLINACRFYL